MHDRPMPSPEGDDPLDLPTTPARVRQVADVLALPGDARARLLHLATGTPPAAEWRRFLATALAVVGTGLLLAGVVCFFAYNWSRIGRFGKLGVLAAAIAIAATLGARLLPRLSGRLALTAAAVLVGPLLGVYGQTYQTGADPYGLFATWTLLIVPWVLAARFAPLWLVFLAVADAAVALWWTQAASDGRGSAWPAAWLLVALLHVAAVAAWEWQRRRPAPWLGDTWAPRAVAASGVAVLFGVAATFVLDPDGGPRFFDQVGGTTLNVPGLLGLLTLAGAIAASHAWHRRVRRDGFMLTAVTAAGMALVAVAAGRVLIEDLNLDVLGLLLVAALVVGEIALGLRWLRGGRGREREA